MEFHQNSSVEKPKGWGTRHTLTLMGFLAFTVSCNMRFNLSMAIISMVNSTKSNRENLPIFKVDYCPHAQYSKINKFQMPLDDDNSNNNLILPSREDMNATYAMSQGWTFNWNEEEQGLILGSFFYGYLISQIPGGFLAAKFGGKWVLSLGLLLAAVLTIISPFAASLGKEYFIAVRIIEGIGEGVSMPCMHSILCKWIPVNERNFLSAAIYSGMSFGSGLTMLMSGYISNWFGWPAIFYISGIITILWFISWTLFVFDTPAESKWISEQEFKYISHSLSKIEHTKGSKIPWLYILRSGPLWAILLCSTLGSYGHYTLLHEIPSYLTHVLHFDIKHVSLLSAFGNILAAVVSIIATRVADILIEKDILSVVAVRKICNTVALWGSCATMLAIAYSGCDRLATIILITFAISCYGSLVGGVIMNLVDICPNYTSILMGIVNTCATFSGFISAQVAGIILLHYSYLEAFKAIFLIAAAICFTANLIYILLASGKEQKWNTVNEECNDEEEDGIHGLENFEQQLRIERFIAVVDIPHFPRNSA